MSSSSADRLISRINALHKSFQLDDGGQLSAMERDLMLGYLRELYELYAHHGGRPAVVEPAARPAPTLALTPPPAPVIPPAPVPQPEPIPVLVPPPAPPVVEVSPPPPMPPAPAPTPAPVPAAAPTPPPMATGASKAVKDLFAEEATAKPFGRQPLADLTRALTINNRVLFSRDLFGNDNELLNTTLRTLNTSGSIAAAQPVLESLARRFEWTEEGKKETATEFIELVRRRYA